MCFPECGGQIAHRPQLPSHVGLQAQGRVVQGTITGKGETGEWRGPVRADKAATPSGLTQDPCPEADYPPDVMRCSLRGGIGVEVQESAWLEDKWGPRSRLGGQHRPLLALGTSKRHQ